MSKSSDLITRSRNRNSSMMLKKTDFLSMCSKVTS